MTDIKKTVATTNVEAVSAEPVKHSEFKHTNTVGVAAVDQLLAKNAGSASTFSEVQNLQPGLVKNELKALQLIADQRLTEIESLTQEVKALTELADHRLGAITALENVDTTTVSKTKLQEMLSQFKATMPHALQVKFKELLR